uniref:Protein ENHANCED DISEASE RESISTANCE 2 C-terminal domain-containing protein n=1 Tax=Alexandrium catenella TaxID=2925 RepID=A0A7S1MCD1_ALECA
MGADTCGCCRGLLAAFRKGAPPAPQSGRSERERFFSTFGSIEELERVADAKADAERANILDLVEVKDVHGPSFRRRSTNFSEANVKAIISFREEFYDCREEAEDGDSFNRKLSRKLSFMPENDSPWGKVDLRGADQNSWDEADGASFQVRGPMYAQDRKKVYSDGALTQLALVDIFESEVDIANMTACKAAGTIRRIRRSGETRRLFVINFRVVPIHLVMVFALPPADQKGGNAALALLNRFMGADMTDAERNKRLKVIPRVVKGPWVAKGLLGETPGIVGTKIPTQYFVGENEIEASFQITASSMAQRIVRVLKPASSALALELAFVVQGNVQDELPEQVLGTARLNSIDVSTLRAVAP